MPITSCPRKCSDSVRRGPVREATKTLLITLKVLKASVLLKNMQMHLEDYKNNWKRLNFHPDQSPILTMSHGSGVGKPLCRRSWKTLKGGRKEILDENPLFCYKRATVWRRLFFSARQWPELKLHRKSLMTMRWVFWEAESRIDPDQTRLPE